MLPILHSQTLLRLHKGFSYHDSVPRSLNALNTKCARLISLISLINPINSTAQGNCIRDKEA